MKRSTIFDKVNGAVLLIIALLVIYPFWYELVTSVSDGGPVMAGKVWLYPIHMTMEAYKYVLSPRLGVFRAMGNSFLYTIVGTAFSVIFTYVTAYALSRQRLKGRFFIMSLFVAGFYFQAGLVPQFIVNNSLGLSNNWLVMILPSAINIVFLIITRSFLDTLPVALEEAAFMDGANDLQIMWRIYMPLSKPILVTIGTFYAISIWNQFLVPLIYLQNQNLQPISLVLYNLIINSAGNTQFENLVVHGTTLNPGNLEAAAITLSIIPLVAIYPFVQKYFKEGLLIGSVKG